MYILLYYTVLYYTSHCAIALSVTYYIAYIILLYTSYYYNILTTTTLIGDSDIVVKMHAVHALQALLNLPAFDVSALKLSVVQAVEALCLLVQVFEESECKVCTS